MLRIRFTDRDLALTRVAPAADMSAELSLSLHLLATRRPESRLGKWHEQLGRQGGTVLHHITLLGEVLLRGGVEHAAQSATRTLQAETN